MSFEETVTIAIPTFNRAAWASESVESARGIRGLPVRIVVIDDAASEETANRIARHAVEDVRVSYVASEERQGILGSWRWAAKLVTSPYLLVLSDDDVVLPEALTDAVALMEAHPSAAFLLTPARYVDAEGKPLTTETPDPDRSRFLEGEEFLELVADRAFARVHGSCLLLRTANLTSVLDMDPGHAAPLWDLNLCVRLAAEGDAVLQSRPLAAVRRHQGQSRSFRLGLVEGSEALGLLGARIQALTHLLGASRAAEGRYRKHRARQLAALHREQGQLIRALVPNLDLTEAERTSIARQELAESLAPDVRYALVPHNHREPFRRGGEIGLPFLELDGQWGGLPSGDTHAIAELERMRADGLEAIVFTWHAFWWLEHYAGFASHLRSSFRCSLDNPRLVVFDLS